MPVQYYKGAIWTNHALSRLRDRGLTQEVAGETFVHSDTSTAGREKGTIQYQKRFDKSVVTVIAKQNEKNEWIIISCWVDPPFPGSDDEKERNAYRAYQKSSFWKQIWITIKRQIGINKY